MLNDFSVHSLNIHGPIKYTTPMCWST